MPEILTVGLGELKLSKNPEDVLVAYGLGSCLGIGMCDPTTSIAGLLHAVLPSHPNGRADMNSKYVDTGIQLLLSEILAAGANLHKLTIRMAGGANMLTSPGFTTTFNIGTRNVETAMQIFAYLKLKISSQEVGGTSGRTVRYYVSDGRMTIRTVGNQEREI